MAGHKVAIVHASGGTERAADGSTLALSGPEVRPLRLPPQSRIQISALLPPSTLKLT